MTVPSKASAIALLLLLTMWLPGVPILAEDQAGAVTPLQVNTLPAIDVTTTSATLQGYLNSLGRLSCLIITAADQIDLTPSYKHQGDRDKYDDVAVSQWSDHEQIQASTYEEYDQRSSPPQPIVTEQIYTSSKQEDIARPPLLLVLINTVIQPHITESLDQYVSDLEGEGYSVRIRAVSGGTPNELKNILQGELASGLVGALFIGELPVFWFEMHDDVVEADGTLGYSRFPTDFYYTDLDGTWADSNGNGICDQHSDGEGSRGPEIWVGRLTANTLAGNMDEEVMLLRNYFAKNHAYRTGDLKLNNCALVYADEDLAPYCAGVGHAYDTTVVITDGAVTTASDYKDRLTHNYEWVEAHIHSTPWTHNFKRGTVSYSDIRAIDPVALFYTLHACSNARYVEPNYMAGWYIFADTYGLAALGSTKTYPEWPPVVADEFYACVGQRTCLGEALKAATMPFQWVHRRWVYAMTLLGDPTLTLGQQGPTPALVSFQWWTDPRRKAETPQRPMNASDAFSHHLTGLSPDTTFYFQAKVTMDGVTAYGDVLSFTTGRILANVAVVGDYDSQLTELLLANNISAEERGWGGVIRDMTEYDVVVVNQPPDPRESTFLKFLSTASDNHVGIVFTSSRPVSSPYGISLLQWYLGNPIGQSDAVGSGDVYYEVSKPQSMLPEGWDEGDTIAIIGTGDRSHAWFWGYSGDVICQVGSLDLGTQGDAVAIGKYGGSTHVLLASLGPRDFTDVSDWTESTRTMFIRGVLAGIADLLIVTTELPPAAIGSEYRAALSARGGTKPYVWTLIDGELPGGLRLDHENGSFSGIGTERGIFEFTIQAIDTAGNMAVADLSVTVSEPLDVSTNKLPAGQVSVSYETTVDVVGGIPPYTWAIVGGTLPNGLELEVGSGGISGTPTEIGAFDFVIKVTDDVGLSQGVPFSMHITPSGGCFIATAAYGTPMAAEVQVLREFRDGHLLTNAVGQAFVDFYYRASPPIAKFLDDHAALKPVVRIGLMPAVAMSAVSVNTTPIEKMAITGLLALIQVALVVWARRRRSSDLQPARR